MNDPDNREDDGSPTESVRGFGDLGLRAELVDSLIELGY